MTTQITEQMEGLMARLLSESVFASREATHAFTPRALDGASGCGLGLRPAIPEDFNERQAAIIEQIVGATEDEGRGLRYDALRERIAGWIRIQDGIDRQRNHYIKDFRNANGFDRKAWAPEVDARFKAGLDEINSDNRQRLAVYARESVALFICS